MKRKFREEKVEDLFSNDALSFDKKKKLNRSKQTLSKTDIQKIEDGLTIESLSTFNVPIFKYKGQVTIHGMFPELDNTKSRQFGYKSLIQNKNKSIGVKWISIDEEKRSRIIKELRKRESKFRYEKSSTKRVFYIIEDFDKSNYEEKLDEMTKIYNTIDKKMFYGKKSMYIMKSFFGTHIYLDVDVKGIYEKNVEPFIEDLSRYS